MKKVENRSTEVIFLLSYYRSPCPYAAEALPLNSSPVLEPGTIGGGLHLKHIIYILMKYLCFVRPSVPEMRGVITIWPVSRASLRSGELESRIKGGTVPMHSTEHG